MVQAIPKYGLHAKCRCERARKCRSGRKSGTETGEREAPPRVEIHRRQASECRARRVSKLARADWPELHQFVGQVWSRLRCKYRAPGLRLNHMCAATARVPKHGLLAGKSIHWLWTCQTIVWMCLVFLIDVVVCQCRVLPGCVPVRAHSDLMGTENLTGRDAAAETVYGISNKVDAGSHKTIRAERRWLRNVAEVGCLLRRLRVAANFGQPWG